MGGSWGSVDEMFDLLRLHFVTPLFGVETGMLAMPRFHFTIVYVVLILSCLQCPAFTSR